MQGGVQLGLAAQVALLWGLHVCELVVRQGQALQAADGCALGHIRPSAEQVTIQDQGLQLLGFSNVQHQGHKVFGRQAAHGSAAPPKRLQDWLCGLWIMAEGSCAAHAPEAAGVSPLPACPALLGRTRRRAALASLAGRAPRPRSARTGSQVEEGQGHKRLLQMQLHCCLLSSSAAHTWRHESRVEFSTSVCSWVKAGLAGADVGTRNTL